MSILLGLDIGGGGGRALVIDSVSGDNTSAFEPWTFPLAPGSRGIGFDADLDGMFAALCRATRRALEKSGIRANDVVAVAVTAMRFGTAVLGEDHEILYAGPNRDGRAGIQGITLAGQYGVEIAQRTGRFPNPGFPIARLLWLAQSNAEAFARARAMVSLNDWVAFKLCGELATDTSQAVETGIYDLRALDWAEDLIERIGLTMLPFPEVRPAGSKLGELGADAAEQLGLEPGIVVAVGGGDTQCAMLGMGATGAGAVGIVAGTTAPLQWVLDEATIDPGHRIWSGCHVVPGRYLLEANSGPVGEALAWAGRTLYPGSPSPSAALLGSAASAPPGADGILSTFGAGVHDGTTIPLPIGSITLSHLLTPGEPERPELARAIVEGLAFGLKKNLELLEVSVDSAAERVLFTGGMSRSDFFAQLLCDVLGVAVEAADCHDSAALGAALCGSVGAGVFESLEAAAAALVRRTRRFSPDSGAAATYRAQFADWDRLRDAQADADNVGRQIRMTQLLTSAKEPSDESQELRRTTILVTASMDDESLELLEALGDVTYASFRDTHTLLTGPSLVEALEGHEVFICEVDPVDAESIQKCKDLRVIATCRGDPVNIDIPGMTALGIAVINAPGRNADAVADITVGFAISLARKLHEANEFLRDDEVEAGDLGKMGAAFGKLQGHELWRKTFGLVGFGAIGRKVAERLVPFGARVIVSDPFVAVEQAALHGATKVTFLEVLQQSDFVSLHLPVTESTEGMMGEEQFRTMKKGSFLINTARAALVDEEALVEALADNHIAAAAIDVFSVEPPGWDHPLLGLDNVIATPHIGGNTHEVATHQGRIIAEDLERILRGEKPLHVLNPECFEHFDLSQPRPEPSSGTLAALADAAGPAVSDLQKKTESARKPARVAAALDESGEEEEDMAAGIPEANRLIMARICREFVQSIITDAALARRASKDVVLHFNVSDLGEEFWFGLGGGAITGGMGAPPQIADVQLKMKAYILDGMFTGRVNAMEKAMEGELSFMGDAAKAMTIQDIQPDLSRLYEVAREKVGDPGDLEQLSKDARKRKRGTPAVEAPAVAAGRPRVGDERDELCDVIDELYRIELITATGGNVSVRVPGEEAMWITPSAMFKGNLDPQIMVKMGMDGQKIGEGGSPSSESMVHIAMYRARPRAKAVIHCHAPKATILANTDLPFLPISTEAAFVGEIPRLPFIMPGTPELAAAVGEAAQDCHAVLLKNHGLLVAGLSLRKTADMAEVIERTAEIILGCYALGKAPPVLPDDVVAQLREMGEMMA